MTSNAALETTIDKILQSTEADALSSIKSALDESKKKLDGSLSLLEGEYDKIIADGRKEADKIEKQIVGSSDLEARNRQLVALEEAVGKVFAEALDKISDIHSSGDYPNLIKTLLAESVKVLGTSDVIVMANARDRDVVQSALPEFPGTELSSEAIDCLGGIIVKSKDGTITFDNTIDARIERLKPLLRKDIAYKFGMGD